MARQVRLAGALPYLLFLLQPYSKLGVTAVPASAQIVSKRSLDLPALKFVNIAH
jgi:hypothetical protein